MADKAITEQSWNLITGETVTAAQQTLIKTALAIPETAYGSIWCDETAGTPATTTITTAGTYYKLTQFTNNGDATNTTPDHTNDNLAPDIDGTYRISLGISFSGTSNSTQTMKFYKNSTAITGATLVRKIGSGGDTGRGALQFTAALVDTDAVSVYVTSDGNGDTCTVDCAVLSMHLIE